MIPVFENPKHSLHAPRFEAFRGNRTPATERPERYDKLAAHLRASALPLDWRAPDAAPEAEARRLAARVHNPSRLAWLEWVCGQLADKQQYIPDVFAPTAHYNPAHALPVRREAAGEPWRAEPLFASAEREWFAWHCFDTHTPIVAGTVAAAWGSAAAAVAAAEWLVAQNSSSAKNTDKDQRAEIKLAGGTPAPRVALALCRPPGHHAGRDYYGGFCHLNNAAIAAEALLAAAPRVAIFDFDFHHGNGTQDIFYARGDVLYVSIHGAPLLTFPFFSGFADERWAGPGAGVNLNLPLSPLATAAEYRAALDAASAAIAAFAPGAVVISAGFDLHADDPLGAFAGVREAEIAATGAAVRALGLPALVVLEGGYAPGRLGPLMEEFLRALSA